MESSLGHQILIVDDVPENLQVLGSMLQRKGYDVNVASSGIDALALVAKQKPDLILMDVAMPNLDGFQVCERLKADDTTKDIPVMFLTAHSDKERIVKGFQVGGVDYITKPFHAAELLARVRTHLELRSSRELIVKRNAELQSLNDEKNELFGIVAHDLKNPLSTIHGIADLLLKDATLSADEAREFYQNIYDSSEAMFALIKNLLDVNAIERGGIKFDVQPTNIVSAVEHSVNTYRAAAEQKTITLHLDMPEVLPMAQVDFTAFVQVFENLLSNAVKYSPHGNNVFIRLEPAMRTLANETTEPTVRVIVQDEGPGLSDDDKAKLFGKFARLSAKPTGGEHSTGLGLSIVKKMAEAMNGRVWCESVLGEGATFIVEFPAVVQ